MENLFEASDLLEKLEILSADELDELSIGVVAMASDGNVVAYNKTEAALSGLTASRVIGRHFFTSVAPCTNNYLIAQRFENEENIDIIVDYVFTLRMAPTPVQLRLLKHSSAARMYLVVRRRDPHAI